jgi:hypothetical protein
MQTLELLSSSINNPQANLENVLNSIFPQPQEENNITRTRNHLGEVSRNFSDEQMLVIISEFQFLIETWLDEYEKEVFKGMTLKEILNEK